MFICILTYVYTYIHTYTYMYVYVYIVFIFPQLITPNASPQILTCDSCQQKSPHVSTPGCKARFHSDRVHCSNGGLDPVLHEIVRLHDWTKSAEIEDWTQQ